MVMATRRATLVVGAASNVRDEKCEVANSRVCVLEVTTVHYETLKEVSIPWVDAELANELSPVPRFPDGRKPMLEGLTPECLRAKGIECSYLKL